MYLLSGDEFLVEEALERVRAETRAQPLAEGVFDDSSDVAEILTALETRSLFGGKRMVVVHGAEGLTVQQAGEIAGYLESPSEDSVLVLVAARKTKLDDAVRKAGSVVTLEAPRGRNLAEWVRRRASARTLEFDDRAAWALIDAVGGDLRALDAAVEQLASGLKDRTRVGAADVRHAFPRLADERMYVLADAVGDRRLPLAMTTLRRLLDQGEEPIVLLGVVAAHMRRLIRAHPHVAGGARAVGSALGLPRWRAEHVVRQARAYREDEIGAALAALAEADVAIKGGDLPGDVALERAVLQIVTGRAARASAGG